MMETMKNERTIAPVSLPGRFLVAALLILSGIVLFARHMEWISTELFDMLVAWHTLFIILGIYAIARRYPLRGITLLLIGVYLLLGGLSCVPEDSEALIWPLALIVAGIAFFVKTRKRVRGGTGGRSSRRKRGPQDFEQPEGASEEGFLRSESCYNGVRHVVLDDIFKGAVIHTFFGGTIVDLRHTHLAPGETYIDVDCTCGGVQLFVPSDWKIVNKCHAFLGGCDDKRWQNGSVNRESTLVIRGKLTVGGLEIRE